MKEKLLNKNIMILGASGLLGNTACYFFSERSANVYAVSRIAVNYVHKKIKLILVNDVNEFVFSDIINKYNIDLLINCIGLTNVEECETNANKAFNLNAELPRILARECLINNVKLVHISTDHFQNKNSIYLNEIEKNIGLLNIYAKSKRQGELNVIETNPSALIVRTNFFGISTSPKKSFSDYVKHNISDGKFVNLFTDVTHTPIDMFGLLETITHLYQNYSGIINICSDTKISKYDLGILIAESLDLDTKFILPCKRSERIDLITRPKNMSLCNQKLKRLLPNFDFSIQASLQRLSNESKNKEQMFPIYFPYGKQFIDSDDINAVTNVLKSLNLTQGPTITEFERNFAKYVGAQYAVSFNSATSALHSVNIANEIKPLDNCVVPANTFVATANSYEYLDANLIILDIDINTRNINLDKLEQLLGSTEVRSVTCVHYAGTPVDMERLAALAKQFNFIVIEDACHGIGGNYFNGKKIGNSQYSHASVFSFHPVKGLTSGEGGMVTTNSLKLYKRLLNIRSHGINKSRAELIKKTEDIWYYEQQALGYNYRMTDIQAALGNSQLKKLDQFIEKRRCLAKNYDKLLTKVPYISSVSTEFRSDSGLHLYVVDIEFKRLTLSKSDFMKLLITYNIATQVHYIPLYRHPYFQKKYGYKIENFVNSELHYEKALSLPLYYELGPNDQHYIVNTIREIMIKYS